jgi:hypothetical protein
MGNSLANVSKCLVGRVKKSFVDVQSRHVKANRIRLLSLDPVHVLLAQHQVQINTTFSVEAS